MRNRTRIVQTIATSVLMLTVAMGADNCWNTPIPNPEGQNLGKCFPYRSKPYDPSAQWYNYVCAMTTLRGGRAGELTVSVFAQSIGAAQDDARQFAQLNGFQIVSMTCTNAGAIDPPLDCDAAPKGPGPDPGAYEGGNVKLVSQEDNGA